MRARITAICAFLLSQPSQNSLQLIHFQSVTLHFRTYFNITASWGGIGQLSLHSWSSDLLPWMRSHFKQTYRPLWRLWKQNTQIPREGARVARMREKIGCRKHPKISITLRPAMKCALTMIKLVVNKTYHLAPITRQLTILKSAHIILAAIQRK